MSSVVLPDPLGPMIATISPRGTEKLTSRSACTCTLPVSYVLSTPRASTIGSGWGARGASTGGGAGLGSTVTAIVTSSLRTSREASRA